MLNSINLNWKIISVGLLIKDNKILLGLRDFKGDSGNLWEFPGGGVEAGEHPREAMIRELKEELSIHVIKNEIADCLCDQRKNLIRLIVFFYVMSWEGNIQTNYHQKLNWFSLQECIDKKIPNINPKLFTHIIHILGNKIN